mgnify:CR=1 FL=1
MVTDKCNFFIKYKNKVIKEIFIVDIVVYLLPSVTFSNCKGFQTFYLLPYLLPICYS